jgi:Kef-type K+ transport system membrane component KefB
MNSIEVIIVLLLLFMAVPDLCRKLQRPALAYSVFVLFGLAVGPLVDEQVAIMLRQAGKVGFLLLLFEVGLEIDLPPWETFLSSLRFAASWSLLQYPVVMAVALLAGLSLIEACVAAAAITGCSVGMAYPAWKHYPGLSESARPMLLHGMVALEMLTIVVLAVDLQLLEHGLRWWLVAKVCGIALTVFLIARFAVHLLPLFQTIIERTTHWRLHWLVLLILVVCAVGERLGLDAPKTAFFLGLALSRAKHHGVKLEDYIAPISHRFLIPVFFVALGLQVKWGMLLSLDALLAFGLAGLLLGLREIMHRRWPGRSAETGTYLLLCPNLTMVALAANVLIERAEASQAAAWLLLTGLFVTVPAILLLPVETSSGGGDSATEVRNAAGDQVAESTRQDLRDQTNRT